MQINPRISANLLAKLTRTNPLRYRGAMGGPTLATPWVALGYGSHGTQRALLSGRHWGLGQGPRPHGPPPVWGGGKKPARRLADRGRFSLGAPPGGSGSPRKQYVELKSVNRVFEG